MTSLLPLVFWFLHSEPTSHIKRKLTQGSEIGFEMKCVSATVKICSGKFHLATLILILKDNKLLYSIFKVAAFSFL